MQGYVDYRAGVVRVDDLNWPFDLNLQAGAASLVVGHQQFTVRPLLWREKMALARFAHLGLAFVQRQFLRLSLAGTALPVDEAELAALSALALWVNTPDESQPALPLDPKLLGTVALNLCRAAGLRPADLDERSAAEVEVIWQAHARSTQTPAANPIAEEDAGQVRILVLPDPPLMDSMGPARSAPLLPVQSESPGLPSAAPHWPDTSLHQVVTGQGRSTQPSAETMTTPGADQVVEPEAEPQIGEGGALAPLPSSTTSASPTMPVLPAMTGQHQPGQHELATSIAATPSQPRTGTSGSKPARRSALAGTFRVTYPSANSPVSTSTVVGGSVAENGSSTQQAPARLSLPTNGVHMTPAFVSPVVHSKSPALASPSRLYPASLTAEETTLGEAMSMDVNAAAISPTPTDDDRQETRPSIEWGALIDELNERLEQAAADLGIDMEE